MWPWPILIDPLVLCIYKLSDASLNKLRGRRKERRKKRREEAKRQAKEDERNVAFKSPVDSQIITEQKVPEVRLVDDTNEKVEFDFLL